MRTRHEHHNRHGFVDENYIPLGGRQLPDDLEMMLGAKDLLSITITYKESTHIYHAPEFECEVCESYEHKTDACPHAELPDITEQMPWETRREWKERTFHWRYGGGLSTVLPPKPRPADASDS